MRLSGLGLPLMLLPLLMGWQHYFRRPPVNVDPLPAALIALDSGAGQRLLIESEARADYQVLADHFVIQSRRAYCGVASTVMVHNALRQHASRMDQASYFRHAGAERMAPVRTSLKGMSLRELSEGLRSHGFRATTVYANEIDAEAFRERMVRNLRTPEDLLLVNYQRAALGQRASGHISPVAAYHAGSDRVLVLDVAAYRHASAWVPTKTLWQAMRQPLNPRTSRTRGFVEVSEDSSHRAR